MLRPARTLCACSTLRDPPRIELSIRAHDRHVLLQFGREVVLGLTTRYALRRAQPLLRCARSSTFRENILDEHEHRRRPADVAAAYFEASEQTLDDWFAETDQCEAIDTDRGAT
jgi:hypothetical protein